LFGLSPAIGLAGLFLLAGIETGHAGHQTRHMLRGKLTKQRGKLNMQRIRGPGNRLDLNPSRIQYDPILGGSF